MSPAAKPVTAPSSTSSKVVRAVRMDCQSLPFSGRRIKRTSNRPSSSSTLSRGRLTSPPTDTVLPTMP